MKRFTIHKDIRKAATLPSWVYTDAEVFAAAKKKIFARSWQLIPDADSVKSRGQIAPFTFAEGILNEPLLLTRDERGKLHCLSNVCTHRGALVAECADTVNGLRCRYHGRRFALDGKFQSMPEFEQTQHFPSKRDDLPKIAHGEWGKFLFASLAPAFPLAKLIGEMQSRVAWMPLDQCVFDPSRSRDYEVNANWALYCDNYLEGFHIPFVHAGLNALLDYSSYRTELFPLSSLQIGIARGGEDCFDIPQSSPDRGMKIAAYYFWLFPNTMFNFYPWGISINIVKPLAADRTRISYLSYVWDKSRLGTGAGGALDKVELEDEAVVESVQRGVRSRLYARGRYSPTQERAVHHFHRLLARFLNG
jgi:choline monooxygenase